MNPFKMREDEIGRKLQEAHQSGELASAASYGKPLAEDSAWAQTPEELRMGFKILKNAGILPPEVELFQERAQLRKELEMCRDETSRLSLQTRLSQLEQKISLRLEALRSHGA